MIAEIIQAMGMLPVPVGYFDAYDALHKGMLDASPCWPVSRHTMGWYEVADPGYFIDVGGLPCGSAILAANADTFNSLDADLQQILLDAGDIAWNLEKARCAMRENAMSLEWLENEGITVIDWSDAEKQRVTDEIKMPILEATAKELDEKGVRGSELLAAWKAQAEEDLYGTFK